MCNSLFTQLLSEESNLSVCEECRFLPLEKAKVVYLLSENIDNFLADKLD